MLAVLVVMFNDDIAKTLLLCSRVTSLPGVHSVAVQGWYHVNCAVHWGAYEASRTISWRGTTPSRHC